jgi:hypothetical protein
MNIVPSATIGAASWPRRKPVSKVNARRRFATFERSICVSALNRVLAWFFGAIGHSPSSASAAMAWLAAPTPPSNSNEKIHHKRMRMKARRRHHDAGRSCNAGIRQAAFHFCAKQYTQRSGPACGNYYGTSSRFGSFGQSAMAAAHLMRAGWLCLHSNLPCVDCRVDFSAPRGGGR